MNFLKRWLAKGDQRDVSHPDWEEQKFHTHVHHCGHPLSTNSGNGLHTHSCVCEYLVPSDHHGFPWGEQAHGGMVRI